MRRPRTSRVPRPVVPLVALLTAASTALVGTPVVAAPAGAPPPAPTVVHEGVVTRQDIPARAGSERDTVVEPHVAVSPVDRDVAIAAAHDSRFQDGGAVTISVAWTSDGGATWRHRPIRGLTVATGGPYDRASDPVVAFGPDGTAYLSVLLIDIESGTCNSAVAVLTSRTGGATWSRPHYVHRSGICDVSDDKNWLVVDTSATSPHRGRVYQFWSIFFFDGNKFLSSPQVVRWSDDHGRTWSRTVFVTPRDHSTQNSQPMIRSDGSIVDTYYDFGDGGSGEEGPELSPGLSPEAPQAARRAAAQRAVIDASGTVFASTSTDGGATWSDQVEVANNAFGFAPGVRCCLFAADIDPVTERMHVAFLGGVGNTDPVYESWSDDGESWTSPIRVSRGDRSGVQRVNVDVAARGGKVYVTYGTRTGFTNGPGRVQQQISGSGNGGRTFGGPTDLGPVSDLRYAARAGRAFPGDYIGLAYTKGRMYGVWAVSSKPPASSTSRFHQVIHGVTLHP